MGISGEVARRVGFGRYLSRAKLKTLTLYYLLPVAAVGITVLSASDFAAYVRAWSGDGTRGVFVAEEQKPCGGMPPVRTTSCPWRGDFAGSDGRTRRGNVELSTSAPSHDVREGDEIPVIDTGHSTKVFSISDGTDWPAVEVLGTVSGIGCVIYSAFGWRTRLRDRKKASG